MNSIVKTLARSVREYKKTSILTPLLVTVEVVMECAIPFVIANLVNQMQAGCSMSVIAQYGAALLVMAVISLIFGGAAGATCANASAGFARNMRADGAATSLEVAFEFPVRLIANALGVPPPLMLEMGKRHGVPVAALVGA